MRRVRNLAAVPRRLYEDLAGPAWTGLHAVGTHSASRPCFSGQAEVSDCAGSADGNALWFVAKGDDEPK